MRDVPFFSTVFASQYLFFLLRHNAHQWRADDVRHLYNALKGIHMFGVKFIARAICGRRARKYVS